MASAHHAGFFLGRLLGDLATLALVGLRGLRVFGRFGVGLEIALLAGLLIEASGEATPEVGNDRG